MCTYMYICTHISCLHINAICSYHELCHLPFVEQTGGGLLKRIEGMCAAQCCASVLDDAAAEKIEY